MYRCTYIYIKVLYIYIYIYICIIQYIYPSEFSKVGGKLP